MLNPDYLVSLNKVGSYQKRSNTVVFEVDDELFEILFLTETLVRFRISQGGTLTTSNPSFACLDNPWPGSEFTVSEEDTRYKIVTAAINISINKENFSVSIWRQDGSVILEPHKSGPFYQFQNNHFVLSRVCLPHEHIYGLGEKTGHLDRHGRKYRMWNKDVLAPDPDKSVEDLLAERSTDPLATDFDPYYMSIPFYYRLEPESQTAAGYFIDNPYPANYVFNNQKNHSHIEIHYEGGEYCEYFFTAPHISAIIEDYSKLTGRINLPPLWALGYHQCRWKKYDHKQLLELAKKQRASEVPCDVLWLDIDYMDEYRVFTWNEDLFPDRQALFSELQKMGFRIISIVDPGIKFEPGYSVFDEAKENDLLCKCENGQIYLGQVWPGKTAFPDFSKPACRQWWGALNAQHVDNGIAGIWNDMNEPATGKISPLEMRFAGEDDGNYAHARYHNEYALLMAMGTVEGLKKSEPNKRSFVLSRAGSPGIQRYAANWLGDNASRWEHLQMSLPMTMGLGLSGQPFIGADVGGFVEATQPELFIRWLQCGIFYPFFRNHNDHPADQYVWSFGEGIQKICQKFIDFRYRLLPYIYTQFVKSHKTGLPIFRPLIFDYQSDPAVRQLEDQFLFGEALLVAPILQPGQTSRTLYLPEGEWFDWKSRQIHLGKKWLSVMASIDEIPLFVKCGSVIPMLTKIPESTMSLYSQTLSLFLALPSMPGTYLSELFEDDGLTENFQKGEYLQSKFSLKTNGTKNQLSYEAEGKAFDGFDRKEFFLEIFADKKLNPKLDSKPLKDYEGIYKIKNSGEAFNLKF